MRQDVLVSGGEVIEVQLTSETLVVEAPGGARTRRAGRITNRMRVFVRDRDGSERNYDFEDASIGVRDGHHVMIVRTRPQRGRDPSNLALFNLSTDQRDVFEADLARFLTPKRVFGPFWRALGLDLLLLAYGVFHSQIVLQHYKTMSILESFYWALFFAFLAFPVLWWLVRVWDRFTSAAQLKRNRAAFIADMESRLRSFAPAPQA